jgi:hypothetical protein
MSAVRSLAAILPAYSRLMDVDEVATLQSIRAKWLIRRSQRETPQRSADHHRA